MTFQEKILDLLGQSGLWPEEAESILENLKQGEVGKAFGNRWGEQMNGYPESVIRGLWLHTQATAKDWLAKNAPQHFARKMFQ